MKNRNTIRILSVILAIVMSFTALPFNVFAVDTEQNNLESFVPDTVNEDPNQEENELEYCDPWDGGIKTSSLAGEGTKESPYLISNGSELKFFANQVNAGNTTYSSAYIQLSNNIDMNMLGDTGNEQIWTPIGVSSEKPFCGHFDGGFHEIINLNITHNSGEKADSTINYIGFFGYIKNASVENLGINGYKIDQIYNYDTEIGAMVAHAENSKISNCYTDGEINASFADSNPLDRDNVVTLTAVPSELNYSSKDNEYGIGVIIDLKNASPAINKTMTISGDVSAVKIKGDSLKNYTGFSIIIGNTSYENIFIEFENFSFAANDVRGAIYKSFNHSVSIVSSGEQNAVKGIAGGNGVDLNACNVSFYGNAPISVVGGNGSNGTTSEKNGVSGGNAIIASSVIVNTTSLITISGGNGGNGLKGSDGASATTAGQKGNDGIDGGNGGDGGAAIIGKLIVINGDLTVKGGNGGSGANGGNGGNGAKGKDGVHESSESTNGGKGGNGGAGGNGGNGADCESIEQISVIDGSVSMFFGAPGNGGNGGNGGIGGDGGNGDTYDFYKWVISWANDKGYKGGDGGQAGDGGNGGDSGTYSEISDDLLNRISCFGQSKVAISLTGSDINKSNGGAKGIKVGTGGIGGKRRAMKLFGGWAGYQYFSAGSTPQNKATNGTEGNISLLNEPQTVNITSCEHDDEQYFIIPYKCTWKEAELICEALGGHLATITSEEEQHTIAKLVCDSGLSSAWLGGYRIKNGSEEWKWITGETLPSCNSNQEDHYANWNIEEPNNDRLKENYVAIYGNIENLAGTWNDNHADAKMGFVFEKGVLDTSSDISLPNTELNRASLYVGGFVGVLDENSEIIRSAAVVNNVKSLNGIDCVHESNKVTSGNFVGKHDGTLTDIICTYRQEGILAKYEISTWFANQSDVKSDCGAYVLNDDADYQGIKYDNGITDVNTVSNERCVIGKNRIGEKTSIIIPDYVYGGKFISVVTSIKERAFHDNETILDVTCGSFVESIGKEAFENSSITRIITGDTVSQIGERAFSSCNGLLFADLGEKVEIIGVNLFADSNNLKTIEIGHSLVDIPEVENGKTPFGVDKSSSKLENYVVSKDNPKYATNNKIDAADKGILYEIFRVGNTDYKVSIIDAPANSGITKYFPQKMDNDGKVAEDNEYYIVRIYPYAFAHNRSLSEVHLDYIRSIGAGAFSNCYSLEKIVFGQYTEKDGTIKIIEKECPIASEKYKTVIEKDAFSNCRKLSEVNLESNALTKIGVGAFYNCATYEGVTPLSITLGKYINSVGASDDEIKNNIQYTTEELLGRAFSDAFDGAKIRSFSVNPENTTFASDENGVLYYLTGEEESNNKEERWLIAYPKNALAETYCIKNDENQDYKITRVSSKAFAGVENLISLVIGDGVLQVGDAAFSNMASLHTLTLGKDVNSIAGNLSVSIGNLFDGCGALESIYVDDANVVYSDIYGVLFNKTHTRLIKYPTAKAGNDYVTPTTVHEINTKAFSGNRLIRHITLSNTITTIGNEAFYDCPNLSFIYFEKGDCPFATTEYMKSGNAFYTKNPRALICFGDKENNTRWKNFSTEEANDDYYSDDITQSGKRYKMFQVAEYTAYPEDIMTTGYYAFVVLDKNGALLNDINVSLGDDYERIDTKNGIAMFLNLPMSQAYNLCVEDNLGEYFPLENSEFYLDEKTKITYITLSAVPTLSGVSATYDVYNEEVKTNIFGGKLENGEGSTIGNSEVKGTLKHKTVDINSETAKINRYLTDKVDIQVSCGVDKDTKIIGLALEQNGRTIETINYNDISDISKRRSVNMTISFNTNNPNLYDEQDVYAVVTVAGTKDGYKQKVSIKLNLHVFTFAPAAIHLPMVNNKVSVEIPQELQKLMGLDSLPLFDNKDKSIQLVTVVTEDSYRTGIEYNRDNLKKFGFDQISDKDAIDLLDEWINDERLFSVTENKSKGGLGFSFGGFVEQKYKGQKDGNPDILISSGIKGTLEFTYGAGTTITIVVVPVRLDVEVKVTGEIELTLEFDKERADKLLPSGGDLDMEITGKVDFYAGVGCSVVSIGVYGNVKIDIVFEILPDPGLEKVTFSTDVGAYVKYNGLFVKWKYTWSALDAFNIPHEWVLVDRESDKKSALKSQAPLSMLYDEANYEIASSSYTPLLKSVALNSSKDYTEEAYSGIVPQMIQVGDKIYVIYQEDLVRFDETAKEPHYKKYTENYAKYDKYNYQKIVYQVYDTKTDELSDVYVLDDIIFDDGGRADGAFEVYGDGTNAIIVYTQLKNRLTSDNIDDMENYVGSLEVKTAVLSDGVFVPSEDTLTNDDFYDFNIHVGMLNGKLTAVWLRNELNSMFGYTINSKTGEHGVTKIYCSVFEDGQWSTPVDIATSDTVITDLEIGECSVAYITDANNDLMTAIVDGQTVANCFNDRIIHIVDLANPEKSTVSPEDNAYFDISYIDEHFVYYLNNNLYYISEEEGAYVFDIDPRAMILSEALENLTEDYQILEDEDGNVKAILYVVTEEVGEEGTEVGCSNIYGIFCEGKEFGLPIKLTDYAENCYVQSFSAIDKKTGMYLSALISQMDSTDNYNTTDDSDNLYRFEICSNDRFINYPTDCTVGKISFDYDEIAPEKEIELTIPITNNGYQTIDYQNISVVIDGKELNNDEKLGFYDEDGKIKYEDGDLLPGYTGYLKVVFVTPKDVTESPYKVSVNGDEQDLKLWNSDFSVSGKQVKIGNQYYIVANIINNGYLEKDYDYTVKYNSMNYSDITLLDGKTEKLSYGKSQYILIPLDEKLIHEDTCVVTIDINADSEYHVTNNTASINVSITPELIEEEVAIEPRQSEIDRAIPKDITIKYSKELALSDIVIDEEVFAGNQELYTQEDDKVIISGKYLLEHYNNGILYVVLRFNNGMKATAIINIYTSYEIKWIIDGKEESVRYMQGVMPTHIDPQKNGDDEFAEYNFIGWDKEIVEVSGDATYTALFESGAKKKYTITWIVGEKRQYSQYEFLDAPSYNGTPTKTSTVEHDYIFSGWDKEIEPVTKNKTYTAVFNEVPRKYIVEYTVNGETKKVEAEYDSDPTDLLPVPEGYSDVQYDYEFAGWSPQISKVHGNQSYEAQFNNTVRQYTVIWKANGVIVKEGQCKYDETPVYEGDTPIMDPTSGFTHPFLKWGEPIVDSTTGIITINAVFGDVKNYYPITFDIHGNIVTEEYEYDAIPTFDGDTSRESDGTYRYEFIGWDKEIQAVTEATTYTAQYNAIKLGSAQILNSPFKTAWGCDFTTVLSLSDVSDMTSSTITIEYDMSLVSLKGYRCFEGTVISEEGQNYITISVSDLIANQSKDVIELTFSTSSIVPFGNSKFITKISSEDIITSNIDDLIIYQMGDVNMDGKVNTVDAAMTQRFAVKKLTLTNVQKVYANVNGDLNVDGSVKVNTVDAAMIQRFAVKKLEQLGDRITITFVDGSDIFLISIIPGEIGNNDFSIDGYNWSLDENLYVQVDFSTLAKNTTVYLIPQE